MGEWQPIETAPKDGTDFIVHIAGSVTAFIDDSDPIKGVYPGGGWKVGKINSATICFWCVDRFIDGTGVEYGEDFINKSQPEGSPDGDPPLALIHWMPLPAPPAETSHRDTKGKTDAEK